MCSLMCEQKFFGVFDRVARSATTLPRFGVRLGKGRFWALVQVGEAKPMIFGEAHSIPVDLWMVPSYLRMIVDDHQLNNPSSD